MVGSVVTKELFVQPYTAHVTIVTVASTSLPFYELFLTALEEMEILITISTKILKGYKVNT